MATGQDGERPRGQVGLEPGVSSVSDAEPVCEALEENGVVNCIECSRQIEEAERGDLLACDSRDEMVVEGQKSCFGRVEFCVG